MNVNPIQPDKPPIDSPIKSSADDALGRAPSAHEFAESIRELDASEGMVVGVLGAWGHGKSSFINLMREEFDRAPALTVVEFNPWMFSGSDQLVNFFFKEIAAQLSIRDTTRFGKIAKFLGEYGGVLEPLGAFLPIPAGGLIGKVLGNVASGTAKATRADKTATELRKEITEALQDLDLPIVVVVDDIDRLTGQEIREIFKLVRLTASFPNIIYVLAFDRERVERALNEEGVPGRSYLEKIVQLSFDVPHVPERLLRSQTFAELDRVLGQLGDVTLDENRWTSVYLEIISPLLKNMRDVTRYAISSRATIRGLGRQVDLVDLLGLEAIRVFRPEILQALSRLRSELTAVTGFAGQTDEGAKQAIANLDSAFPADQVLIGKLIRQIFPAARQYVDRTTYGYESRNEWRRDHRVAHVDFLSLYLDRVSPDELVAFHAAEKAFGLLDDQDALSGYLKTLDPGQLEEVFQGLEVYERRFPTDAVVPSAVTLFNLIHVMPKNEARGMFDLSRPDIAVTRVVLRMLRRVEAELVREQMATAVLDGLETYSSKLSFLTMIGYLDDAGHKLVSEAFSRKAEDYFFDELARIDPKLPEREWDILRVYWQVKERTNEPPLRGKRDAALLGAVLSSAKSTNRRGSFDSPVVTLTDVLAWDPLVEVFGDEAAIKSAAEIVREQYPDLPVLDLVDHYLEGWRPKNWGDSD